MFMLKSILENFFKKPATRHYPMIKREPFERHRGRLENTIESCIYCRLCANKCPVQCIETDPKRAFWGYDPFACVYCGLCADICPTKSLTMFPTHRAPVPTKFVIYHKGEPRVTRPKQAQNAEGAKTESAAPITAVETPVAVAPTTPEETPQATQEKPIAVVPEEKPVATASEEKPQATPKETPATSKPDAKPIIEETPVAVTPTIPEEKPVIVAPKEKTASASKKNKKKSKK